MTVRCCMRALASWYAAGQNSSYPWHRKDWRRRVHKQELLTISSQPQQVEAVLDSFAHYRLLTLDHDPATGAPTVEVAHEALLRTWGRLKTWISQSREDLRLHRRLLAAV